MRPNSTGLKRAQLKEPSPSGLKITQIFSPKGFVLLAEGFSPVLLCFFALFILLTWPVWRWLWGEWWRNDYYSHGMLIVPIALYLAWRRMSNDKQFDWSRIEGDSRGLLAFTFYHNYSGFITFFLAFLLLIPLTKLLQCNTVRAEVL